MFKKILYIGSGNHIEPLQHFHETKSFVFIDSQPINEYGFEYYYRPYYRPCFLTELKLNLQKINFKLTDSIKLTNKYPEISIDNLDCTKLFFGDKKGLNLRDEKSLIYYISTGIPKSYFDIEKHLKEDMKDVDSILVSGHLPHSILIKDIKKPFNFICYESTVIPKNIESLDEEDKYSVVSYILNYPQDVKSYVHVKHNGEKTFFNQYENFYDYHKSILSQE